MELDDPPDWQWIGLPQPPSEQIERSTDDQNGAGVGGRHRRAADQRLGQLDRIDRRHGRASSPPRGRRQIAQASLRRR